MRGFNGHYRIHALTHNDKRSEKSKESCFCKTLMDLSKTAMLHTDAHVEIKADISLLSINFRLVSYHDINV